MLTEATFNFEAIVCSQKNVEDAACQLIADWCFDSYEIVLLEHFAREEASEKLKSIQKLIQDAAIRKAIVAWNHRDEEF